MTGPDFDDEASREAAYDMTYEEANEERRSRPCRCSCSPIGDSPCRHCDNSCPLCRAPEDAHG